MHAGRLRRGHRARRAGSDIESRAVARALDAAIDEPSLEERAAVMRTDIVDAVESIALADDQDKSVVSSVP